MISCVANNPDNNDASDRNINDAPNRNIDELMTWARSRNWRIALHEYIGNGFVIINRRFQCQCQCHDVNVTVSMSGTENCECSCAEQE